MLLLDTSLNTFSERGNAIIAAYSGITLVVAMVNAASGITATAFTATTPLCLCRRASRGVRCVVIIIIFFFFSTPSTRRPPNVAAVATDRERPMHRPSPPRVVVVFKNDGVSGDARPIFFVIQQRAPLSEASKSEPMSMSTPSEWAPAPAPSLADASRSSSTSVFVDVDQRSVTPVDKRASASEEAKALFDTALSQRQSADAPPTRVVTCAAPLDAFIVRGCVGDDECEALMRAAERAGYSFWSAEEESRRATAGTSESADAANDYDRRGSDFRNADTVEVHSTTIADELWRRLRAHVEEEVIVDASHPLAEPGTEGKWVACGVNDHLLFNRYDASGHFSPHTDGATIRDFNCRSLYSVLVYLNDCERGGETSLFVPPSDAAPNKFILDDLNRYRWPKEWIVDAAPVERGSVLVFRQDIPHEGAPVGEGHLKRIIRTDVMYRREPPLFDDAVGLEAYRLHQDAMRAEASGDAMSAMRLFRHCRRLCPDYANLVGIH